jgi:hypothetical protein
MPPNSARVRQQTADDRMISFLPGRKLGRDADSYEGKSVVWWCRRDSLASVGQRRFSHEKPRIFFEF